MVLFCLAQENLGGKDSPAWKVLVEDYIAYTDFSWKEKPSGVAPVAGTSAGTQMGSPPEGQQHEEERGLEDHLDRWFRDHEAVLQSRATAAGCQFTPFPRMYRTIPRGRVVIEKEHYDGTKGPYQPDDYKEALTPALCVTSGTVLDDNKEVGEKKLAWFAVDGASEFNHASEKVCESLRGFDIEVKLVVKLLNLTTYVKSCT